MEFESPVVLDPQAGLVEPKSLAITPSEFTGNDNFSKESSWRQQVFEVQKAKHGLIEPEPEKIVISLSHIPEVDRFIQSTSNS